MSDGPFYQPGTYWCRITEQALGKAKTGTAQFILRFEVLGIVDPSNPSGDLLACPRYSRTYYRAITEKTVEFLADDLERLGFTRGSLRFLDPSTEGFQDFCGREQAFFCKHETDQQGHLRERWGLARDAKPLEVEAVDDKELRKLDALFGRQQKQSPKQAAKRPEKTVPTAPAAVEVPFGAEDDIPF